MVPLCAIIALVATSSCSTSGRQITVELKRAALVTTADGKATQLKADEKFKVQDKPIFVESPGHVGMMLIPLSKDTTDIQLSLRPIADWPGREFEERANEIASDVIAKVIQLQIDVASGKGNDLLRQIDDLTAKYPRVSYLKFMKVSALVIQGRKEDAVVSLTEALREFPSNPQGLSLFRDLTGKDFDAGGVKP